jgi:hypothetical protein
MSYGVYLTSLLSRRDTDNHSDNRSQSIGLVLSVTTRIEMAARVIEQPIGTANILVKENSP